MYNTIYLIKCSIDCKYQSNHNFHIITYRSLPGKRPQDHSLYIAISSTQQYQTLTQSMGPKITSFEKKSRGISRTATVDGADQEGWRK